MGVIKGYTGSLDYGSHEGIFQKLTASSWKFGILS